MSETVKIYCGSKFFRFVNDQLEMIRVYKVDDKKQQVRYFTAEKEKKSMSVDYLLNNYKRLAPDGMIIVSVVMTGEVRDVIIALKNLRTNVGNLPDVVCRQGIYDVFSHITNRDENTIYVGISMSQDSCPADINFQDTLACTSKKDDSELPIFVYLDDSLDEILSLFSHKRYDDAIKECSLSLKGSIKDKNIIGTTMGLRELLEYNNFMYDFRRCFKIMELPFHIDAETEGLSQENILYMEKELQVNIMETYVMEYSREIDLKSIKRDYMLVVSAADKFDKVYICGYDTTDTKYVQR